MSSKYFQQLKDNGAREMSLKIHPNRFTNLRDGVWIASIDYWTDRWRGMTFDGDTYEEVRDKAENYTREAVHES